MLPVRPPLSVCARRAEALRPLLVSLGREVRVRSTRLAWIRVELERTTAGGRRDLHVAERAEHRRALRRVHDEISRLGCQLVASDPFVFCVEGEDGEVLLSLVLE